MKYLFTKDYVSMITADTMFNYKKGQILNIEGYLALDSEGKVVFGVDSPDGEMYGMVID